MSDSAPPRSSVAHCRVSDYTPFCVAYSWSVGLDVTHKPEVDSAVIPKLWPAGHFWPAASYKMARQDLWSRIFYLHHVSV